MLNILGSLHNWKNIGQDQSGMCHYNITVNKTDIHNNQLILEKFLHPLTGKSLKNELLQKNTYHGKEEAVYWSYFDEFNCILRFII